MNDNIVVFGEVLADLFPDQAVIGGAPFNVARNLAWLGLPVLMVSRIGHDALGRQILAEMQAIGAAGLSNIGIQCDTRLPSGQVRVTLDPQTHAHQFEILPDQAYDKIDASQALAAWHRWQAGRAGGGPSARSIVCCGTVAQRDPVSAASLRQLLQQMQALCFVDLNLRSGQFTDASISNSLQMADILKLNQEEWQYLAGRLMQDEAAAETDLVTVPQRRAMERMLQHYDLQALLITLGPLGYRYLDRSGQYIEGEPASLTRLVDTVGAGDAFASVFLFGFSQGWNLALSLQRAQAFASAVCGLRGAAGDASFYAGWRQRWQLDSPADAACAAVSNSAGQKQIPQ